MVTCPRHEKVTPERLTCPRSRSPTHPVSVQARISVDDAPVSRVPGTVCCCSRRAASCHRLAPAGRRAHQQAEAWPTCRVALGQGVSGTHPRGLAGWSDPPLNTEGTFFQTEQRRWHRQRRAAQVLLRPARHITCQ